MSLYSFVQNDTCLLEFFPMLALIVKLKVQSYGLSGCFAKKIKGELTGAWLHFKTDFFFDQTTSNL